MPSRKVRSTVKAKTSPPPGVFVVSADFSENYAFVLQDAAQVYHWNNAQATIHPFVIDVGQRFSEST